MRKNEKKEENEEKEIDKALRAFNLLCYRLRYIAYAGSLIALHLHSNTGYVIANRRPS